MSYIKQDWKNLPDESTPISAERLIHMEEGIYNADKTANEKVDKVTGKGLSTNDFTNDFKNKLDGIEEGANKTVVDNALSSSSTNPVQNKVVNAGLSGKANSVHNHAFSEITDTPTTLDGYGITDAESKGAANTALNSAKGYTDTKISELINGAPSTMDTLKEIADAMAENQSVVEALNTAIGTKASNSDLTAHTENTSIHITEDERSKWNDANSKKHVHNNKSILDNTTASYTEEEKEKLSGIEDGANKTIIDSALNSSSTNPVQNKVVNEALGNKLATNGDASNTTVAFTEATTLSKLTTGEKMSVLFGKVSKAISTLISHISTSATASVLGHVKVDDSLSLSSTNPVQNKIVTEELNNKADKEIISDAWNASTTYAVGQYCIYNNSLWKCLVQHNGQTPTEGTYWTKVSVGKEIASVNSSLNNIIQQGSNYVILKNGVKMCWGGFPVTDENYVRHITFPIEFTGVPICIIQPYGSSPTSYTYTSSVKSVTNNQLIGYVYWTMLNGQAIGLAQDDAIYFAIGY